MSFHDAIREVIDANESAAKASMQKIYCKVVLNIEIRLRAPALNRLCQKACLGTNNGP